MVILNHDLLLNVKIDILGLNGKKTIKAELKSLNKCKIFGFIILTPENVKLVGYLNKLEIVWKSNEKNEIARYKARFVAQGFFSRPGIDF